MMAEVRDNNDDIDHNQVSRTASNEKYSLPPGFPPLRPVDFKILDLMFNPPIDSRDYESWGVAEQRNFNIRELREYHKNELQTFSCYEALCKMETDQKITCYSGKRADKYSETCWLDQFKFTVEMAPRKIEISTFFSGVARELSAYLFIKFVRFRYPSWKIPEHKIYKEILYEDAILNVIMQTVNETRASFGFKVQESTNESGSKEYKVGIRVREKVFYGTHPVKMYAILSAAEKLYPLLTGYPVKKMLVYFNEGIDKEARYVETGRHNLPIRGIDHRVKFGQGNAANADEFFAQDIDDVLQFSVYEK